MMSKKNVPATIAGALKIIAEKLARESVDWVLVASCALAVQGLDIEPVDIDIMTDERGLLKINGILDSYKISLSARKPSEIFDSTMSKFCINSCSVEVMSNFKIKSRSDHTWHDMNNLLNYRDMIDVAGLMIPILPLSHLVEMYTLMGRDKDMIKIKKIAQHLLKV